MSERLSKQNLLIVDELGYVPLSKTGSELLFEILSQRYEQASTLVTSNLPFNEWTEIFGSERLTGAVLDRLTHHVHILEMNGDSYRLEHSKKTRKRAATPPSCAPTHAAGGECGLPLRLGPPPPLLSETLAPTTGWSGFAPPLTETLRRRSGTHETPSRRVRRRSCDGYDLRQLCIKISEYG